MPTYEVRQLTAAPTDLGLSHLGARLDISVGEPGLDPESSTYLVSSSSSLVEFPLLSSSASGVDYAILLYKQSGDGREHFIGICSPIDMQQWPEEEPDAVTGFYRKQGGEWTFRDEELLEQFRSHLLDHIQRLADSLSTLATLGTAETVTYDASEELTDVSSSSATATSFTLRRDVVATYPDSDPTGYRLRVTCESVGGDEKIFLHRNDTLDRDGNKLARPIAVCSPGDLVDYPAGAPSSSQFPPHYRKATFDIVSANIPLLLETWDNIKTEVEQLAMALQVHEETVSDTTVSRVEPNV